MTTAQPPATDEVKAFFDQWQIYDLILRHDYMAHRGIQTTLRQSLTATQFTAIDLLDLGCGDSSLVVNTLAQLPIRSYTGIDLSPVALSKARQNLQAVPYPVTLLEADFTTALAQFKPNSMDIILLGFTLHHLQTPQKQHLLSQCRTLLRPAGSLYLYDVFRRDGESREQYIRAYCAHSDANWSGLPAAALQAAQTHLATHDYPETYASLSALAEQAGLQGTAQPAFQDAQGFHCLFQFTPASEPQ